ncbi:hypothetical protein [Hufsiella ginkgonis]|uniref:Uncharacterized protein n=1 Tax=Hufsiella ginkgonis TaxID=2695274 RepID=A0A7K1Y4D6_9SPHI|nr:hypothetical protein [Hufsiella ginkgonis]MXV17727.1 hypothetical protein [Hufsiella ginkgonis]
MKRILLFLSLVFITSIVKAQNLSLAELFVMYSNAMIDSRNATAKLDDIIKKSSTSWTDYDHKQTSSFISWVWYYEVGKKRYGAIRWVIQKLSDGTGLPKLVYEFPYKKSYQQFTEELKMGDAQEVDNFEDRDDGSVNKVFTRKGDVFIMSIVPRSETSPEYYRVMIHRQVK